jgi:hypothetical protein
MSRYTPSPAKKEKEEWTQAGKIMWAHIEALQKSNKELKESRDEALRLFDDLLNDYKELLKDHKELVEYLTQLEEPKI